MPPSTRVSGKRRARTLVLAALVPAALLAGPAGPAQAATAPCGNGMLTTTALTSTCTYSLPGTDTFTLPAGVTVVTFNLNGAQGGGGTAAGLGGFVAERQSSITTGSVYRVTVGQAGGQAAAGGAPDGGAGGITGTCQPVTNPHPCGNRGYGGGGSSQVANGTLLVALAPGGGGAGAPSECGSAGGKGGAGGATGLNSAAGSGADAPPIFVSFGRLNGGGGGKISSMSGEGGVGGVGGDGFHYNATVPSQLDSAGFAGRHGVGPNGDPGGFPAFPPFFGGFGGQATPTAANCGGGGGGGGGGGYGGGGGGGGGGQSGSSPDQASGGGGGGGGQLFQLFRAPLPGMLGVTSVPAGDAMGVRHGNGMVAITFTTPLG